MNFMLCTGEHNGPNPLYSFRVSVTGGLMAPVHHIFNVNYISHNQSGWDEVPSVLVLEMKQFLAIESKLCGEVVSPLPRELAHIQTHH